MRLEASVERQLFLNLSLRQAKRLPGSRTPPSFVVLPSASGTLEVREAGGSPSTFPGGWDTRPSPSLSAVFSSHHFIHRDSNKFGQLCV